MPLLRKFLSALQLAFFAALIFAASCWNWSQVFITDGIYYIDADCYARMTRVQMVLNQPGLIIEKHLFENYPDGIISHTTAPLDYLIAGLSLVFRPFSAHALDLAGAFISPLLGILAIIFLWFWSRRARLPYRGALLLLYALSPIIGHGFLLGRPDHQSLVLLLMTIALAAEWMLWQKPSRPWSFVSGAAFGLGMWVSFYEPLILFGLAMLLRVAFYRRTLFSREILPGLALCAGLVGLSLLIEGSPGGLPANSAEFHSFKTWVATVGEMRSVTLTEPLLYQWAGFLLVLAPILLPLAIFRGERKSPAILITLAAVFALTIYQLRWGYFFAMYFAMCVPLMLTALRWKPLAWAVYIVCLWPVAGAWESQLFPSTEEQQQLAKQRLNAVLLRDASTHLSGPFLAPWWTCPALAYWSGQPAIAGSSHESLPGITDSSRFFLTEDPEEARAILRKRGLQWVVVYEGETVAENASKVLNLPKPPQPLGELLYNTPSQAPDFLRFSYQNPRFPYYKIYHVETDRL